LPPWRSPARRPTRRRAGRGGVALDAAEAGLDPADAGAGAGAVVPAAGLAVVAGIAALGEAVGPAALAIAPTVVELGAAATTGPRGSAANGKSPRDAATTIPRRTTAARTRLASRRSGAGFGLTVVRTIPCASRGYHRLVTPAPASLGAAQLLRSVGLLADGPGRWGRPLSASGPGVFAIELALPSRRADRADPRREVDRAGGNPPARWRPADLEALAARLAAFWLPSQTVVYVGGSDVSVARRLASMARTGAGRSQAVLVGPLAAHAPWTRRPEDLVGADGRHGGVRGRAPGGVRPGAVGRRTRGPARSGGGPALRQPAPG
jgi:hypothetical protein